MKRAIITGGDSGLGRAIVSALDLQRHEWSIYVIDNKRGHDVRVPQELLGDRAFKDFVDGGVDVLINCAGINKINWAPDVSPFEWDNVMETNAKALFFMTQMLLPQLRAAKGTVLNIVSNAAHMPMRCSAAYNASKGAALILTKQLARELAPDITVFSVSPNKLAGTGMSKSIDKQVCKTRGWTMEQAQAYQKQSLLTGEETPPELVAEFIAFLLSSKERHKYLTGCDIPYGA